MQFECRNCKTTLKYLFCDLGFMPPANSYLRADQLDEPEAHYPLRAYVCDECKLVQVPSVIKPEDVFREYAYFSGQSSAWVKHCVSYAHRIDDRFAPSRVLEIASNDGTFLNIMRESDRQLGVQILGVEPARNVAWKAQLDGVPTINEFFGAGLAHQLKDSGFAPDVIVANNVLAHVPDLDDFLIGILVLLSPSGVVTFEFPHLVKLIETEGWDTIYHEHLSYFTFWTVKNILRERGFDVFDVEEIDIHGGSLRVYACPHGADRQVSPRVPQMVRYESGLDASGVSTGDPDYMRVETYAGFTDVPRQEKRRVMNLLGEISEPIVGYGAAAKFSTWLNYMGLGPETIPFIIDSTPEKQDTFTPGSHIPIISPALLEEHNRVVETFIIGPWNWRETIEAKILRTCPDARILSRPFR